MRERIHNKASLFFTLTFCAVLVVILLTMWLGSGSHSPMSFKEPKYVYIDLGANNGDSLMSFFELDFYQESHVGGSLSYKNYSKKDTQWEVYAFEANPFFNPFLSQVESEISEYHKIYMYNETAAWTYDGTIEFYLDVVNVGYNYWGSSLDKNHPDVLNSGRANVTVECRDIARILSQFDVHDMVVLKMDIEGAEYELLIDFLKKDVYKLIDYMAVEFHPFIQSETTKESILIDLITIMGTKFVEWH